MNMWTLRTGEPITPSAVKSYLLLFVGNISLFFLAFRPNIITNCSGYTFGGLGLDLVSQQFFFSSPYLSSILFFFLPSCTCRYCMLLLLLLLSSSKPNYSPNSFLQNFLLTQRDSDVPRVKASHSDRRGEAYFFN